MIDQRKNIILFAVSLLMLLFVLSIFSVLGGTNKIDNAPIEGLNPNSEQRVILTNGEELMKALQNSQTLDRFSSDLYVFGKAAYSAYDNSAQSMGFLIESVSRENDSIVVQGRFGQSANKIVSKIIKLNNTQLSLGILDTSTGLNIDAFLPSNRPKNQLIGALPIDATGYTISYLSERDEFVINTFNNESNYNIAVKIIRDALGEELFNQQKIIKYGAGDKIIESRF
jgi:hypothetical protein